MTLNHLVGVRIPVGQLIKMSMKKCAIILNGSDVVKVNNLKRKYNKLVNNPNIKILEECDEDQLENRYNYWITSYSQEDTIENDVIKYIFTNSKTGQCIKSIYNTLDNIPNINKNEWIEEFTK